MTKRFKSILKGIAFMAIALATNVLFYMLLFTVEIPLHFSYSGNNCIRRPLLLPNTYAISGSSTFDVYVGNNIRLGNINLVSTSMCFVPNQAPKEGDEKVTIAPVGGVLASSTFSMNIPKETVANHESLSKPVPATKDLIIPLNGRDVIFSYMASANNKVAPCKPENATTKCNIKALNLNQGAVYKLTIDRFFKKEKVDRLIDQKEIQTLAAVHLKDSTIKAGETVFARPKSIDFTLDKKITKQDVKLYRKEGDKRVDVPVKASAKDAVLTVALEEDLSRQMDYEIVLNSVEAEDGSGLEDPVTVAFYVSGGPKVVNIDIPKTKVPLGATATITFDQPLLETQDIARALKLGGGAAYSGKKGNRVFITLKDIPKCGTFSIEVTDELQSSFEVKGGSSWSFSSRMICHTVSVIGYSTAGRPISAYFFGNGPRTILYTGAIHGNEVSTKYLMDRWIQELEANATSIPADKSVIIVPSLNPDGVAAGTRTNVRNVDLNRNFAVSDWQKDITDVNNRPFPGGGGESPMSEAETKVIAAFVQQQRPIFVMSFHSIGGLLVANQAGDSVTRAAFYSQLSGYRNATGQSAQTFNYSITGTADDWYGEALGIPSVLVELSSHTSAQFERNQKALWKMLNM